MKPSNSPQPAIRSAARRANVPNPDGTGRPGALPSATPDPSGISSPNAPDTRTSPTPSPSTPGTGGPGTPGTPDTPPPGKITAPRRKYHPRKREKREAYGAGSCSPCMAVALDEHGNILRDVDGEPLKTQERDRFGQPVWLVCISRGVEVSVGEDGSLKRRQRKVQHRVHGSIDDARKVASQLREDYARIDIGAMGMTFSDACRSWATSMRNANTCSAAKLRDYTTALDRIAEQLGDTRIATMKGHEIESALVTVRNNHNLSQYSHRNMFQLVRRVFAYCISNDWIARDPSHNLQTPRITEETSRHSLEPRECERLRTSLDRDELAAYEALDAKERRREKWGRAPVRSRVLGLSALSGLIAVRLMLATGMRRGEVLGLTWDNVDLTHRQITVRQSLNAQMVLKSPKTKRGVRTISIDADTVAHLRKFKNAQTRILRHLPGDAEGGGEAGGGAGGAGRGRGGVGGKAGAGDGRGGAGAGGVGGVGGVGSVAAKSGGSETGANGKRPATQIDKMVVCCNCSGGMLDPSKCSQWWRAYRATIGFPELCMHELRHTQATMLLGHGVSVKDVQARLGHASASLTLDVYGHAIPANDRKAANLMGSIYGSSK